MEFKNTVMKYRYQIYLSVMWLLTIVLVNPLGEFAVNDDWAYAKNVYHLVVNKTFVVDQWPAMNLISQTMYGAMVTTLFGFSFTALRLSIFLLSYCASLYLFKITKKLSGQKDHLAFVVTCTLVFNALYMHLSMTYMTDVFFVSMLIFALHALVNYSFTPNLRSYGWFCFWCVMAILCRQQALIFALLIVPPVLKQSKNRLGLVFQSVLPALLCWLASDQYRHYLTEHHIWNGIQQMTHLFTYLKEAPFEKQAIQFADSLLVLSGHLIPLSVVLVVQGLSNFKQKDWIFILLSLFLSIALTFKAAGFYPIGNVSEMLEIGPRMIKAGGEVAWGDWAQVLHGIYYTIALLSLTTLLFFVFKMRTQNSVLLNSGMAKGLNLLVVIVYLLFILGNNAYFDRYVLPLVLLVLLLLTPAMAELTLPLKSLTTGIILLLFALGLVENLDYFHWQKKRLEAVEYLHQKGITSNKIDGGFEYNGWFKQNRTYPTDSSKSWWWVVEDQYLISASSLVDTKTDTVFVYQRFLPFKKDTVFLLHKERGH